LPSIKGPDFITLLVRDLEKSRHFFHDILGFQPSPEVRPNAVAFSAEPISFAIRQSSEIRDAKSNFNGGIYFWFKTDDSPALCKHLREHGVPIVEDIADSPFGKTFTFLDPDGHFLSVHDGG